eukprot:m51a1_g12491 hypothetical protein (78) ;mRNA; f:1761-3333
MSSHDLRMKGNGAYALAKQELTAVHVLLRGCTAEGTARAASVEEDAGQLQEAVTLHSCKGEEFPVQLSVVLNIVLMC